MAVSVSSKGQVTIPKRMREALGITPGIKVEFDIAGGGARLKAGQEARLFTHRGGGGHSRLQGSADSRR
jgi:AbrB family looped-hinge helix DNA binding protein